MSDPLDRLKDKWHDAKSTQKHEPLSSQALVMLAKKKMKSTVNLHIGNIAVLTFTLIGLSAFFIFVAPFNNTLSHIGILLMLGGLALRIIIECYSIYKSRQINLSDSAANNHRSTVSFHAYRKRIHGSVTVAILVAYTVGFYVLTPEFLDYFSVNKVILMDISYLGAASIFIYSIRKAIQSEMKLLDELKELSNEFT